MVWVGLALVRSHVLKAQTGPAPARGKRMDGWTLESAQIANKERKWPPEDTRKPSVLTLWAWLRVGWHQWATGAQVAVGARVSVFLLRLLDSETTAGPSVLPSKSWADKRDEKPTSLSTFPTFVFQCCHLMKMQDSITFSCVFVLSVMFPKPMPNKTLVLWSQMEPPAMPVCLSEAVPAGLFKKKRKRCTLLVLRSSHSMTASD